MKLYRLKTEDAAVFKGLDPYGWLSLLALPNAFAIGAVAKGGRLLIAKAADYVRYANSLHDANSPEWRTIKSYILP